MRFFTLDYFCWNLIPAAVLIGTGVLSTQSSHWLPQAMSPGFLVVGLRALFIDPDLESEDVTLLEFLALLAWFLAAVLLVTAGQQPPGSTGQHVGYVSSLLCGGVAAYLHFRHFRKR